ncbi:helicase-associated domain-containing protein [Oerskovia flava]|uniref:helicase-associated domain-containing protein n=1 Tax=Oerskovia flava TaxID=2986422 RepID=UPI00223EADA2|nr:helicase-associated domain-containing protein [Oerskovia sp. JB1-3-2]
MPSPSTPGGRTFSDALRSRSDEDLVALLLRRPDLGRPSPSTLRSLAARASSRTSIDRALVRLDVLEVQVLEAVVVLGEGSASPTGAPLDPTALLAALTEEAGDEPDADLVLAALDRLVEQALVWDAAARPGGPAVDLRPSPGLAEALGPYPAGLGPRGRRVPADLGRELADAPPGAREILAALTWGPPVGVAPTADPRGVTATRWLTERSLLLGSDERHVVLPREVALALRGGRTHARVDARPPRPEAPQRPEATVAAESADAAREIVRHVSHVVAAWRLDPPSVLRSGGLSVRDLRRLARELGTHDEAAVLAAELAFAAGLVADDGDDPPSYAVTVAATDWAEQTLSARWAVLTAAWGASPRTPWLVGTRDEKGARRSPLEQDMHRPWVVRLRRAVLDALAAQPGAALDEDAVLEVLHWHTPRAAPPAQAVRGLLREAEALGVTGVGALAPQGVELCRVLAGSPEPADGTEPTTAPVPIERAAGPGGGGGATAALAAALEGVLPPEVDDLLLQGDLTGIIPGRPSGDLERLVDAVAEVESRGAATTVRFTPDSVVRALDQGRGAEDLLTDLAAHSRTPLPQPLEYLVRDTARRHGRLRVGAAMSYVRAEDPVLLTGLVEDLSLRHLTLVRIAPTVLVAHAPAADLQDALRAHGLVSAVEGPDGRVLRTEDQHPPARPAPRRGGFRGRQVEVTSPRAAAERLVAQLRATGRTDDAQRTGPGPTTDGGDGPRRGGTDVGQGPWGGPERARVREGSGTTDPADALSLLREAIDAGTMVWLEVVGPQGSPARRRVRPVTLEAGRLRAQDLVRDAELTVAVHRIASVTLDLPDDPDDGSSA